MCNDNKQRRMDALCGHIIKGRLNGRQVLLTSKAKQEKGKQKGLPVGVALGHLNREGQEQGQAGRVYTNPFLYYP